MPDFTSLMKQAAELQAKMQAMQAELDQIEVEGTAGGGAVTVKLTAKTELKSVAIDASLLKPEDKEIVEDLLVAAHADARRKAEVLLQEQMQQLTGGLPLPPGLKLISAHGERRRRRAHSADPTRSSAAPRPPPPRPAPGA